MMVPLEAPQGWFLLKAEHQHTSITFRDDTHVPLPHAAGPWYVEFQKYPNGGRMRSGRGFTLEEAWHNAAVEAEKTSLEMMANGET